MQIAIFFAYFSVSQKRNIKRSPNGMKPSRELFLERKQSRRLGVDVGEALRKPRGREARPTPLGAPPPSWTARDSSSPTLLLRGFFWSIKNNQKLARQLDSVWYSFSIKLKNKEKQKLALGSRLIG